MAVAVPFCSNISIKTDPLSFESTQKTPKLGSFFLNEPNCKPYCKRHKVQQIKCIHQKVRENKLGSFRRNICRVLYAPLTTTTLTDTPYLGLDSVLVKEAPFSKNCADYTCPITLCPVKLSINDIRPRCGCATHRRSSAVVRGDGGSMARAVRFRPSAPRNRKKRHHARHSRQHLRHFQPFRGIGIGMPSTKSEPMAKRCQIRS